MKRGNIFIMSPYKVKEIKDEKEIERIFHTHLQKYIHSPCLIIRQNETAGSNSTKPMKPAD